MARLFDDATSETLTTASTPVNSFPYSMSAWFNSDNPSGVQGVIMCLVDTVPSDEYVTLTIEGAEAGDPISIRMRAGGGGNLDCITGNGITASTWHHAFSSLTDATTRTVILDGDIANKGSGIASQEPVGMNIIAIGSVQDSSPGFYLSGAVGEAAIWDAALTDAEGVILSKGYSPLLVRPQNLVFYAPLINTEYRDIVGGLALTPVNTPSTMVHPRVIYPVPPHMMTIAAAAPPVVGGILRRPYDNYSRNLITR